MPVLAPGGKGEDGGREGVGGTRGGAVAAQGADEIGGEYLLFFYMARC